MSQQNVEVVRRLVEAYVAGEMESFKSLLAPDVEWKQVEEPEAAHGPDATLAAVERWGEMWEDLEVEVSEYIDADAKVLVISTWKGRGVTSGINVEQSAYYLYTVRDGKVVQMQEYWSGGRDEAFEAAGLGRPRATISTVTHPSSTSKVKNLIGAVDLPQRCPPSARQ